MSKSNHNLPRVDYKSVISPQARTVEQLQLAAKIQDTIRQKRSLLVELKQQTDSLTKKDIATWRRAHQVALDVENPNRQELYGVYSDTILDMHLEGCFGQRNGKTLQKAFIINGADGKENEKALSIFQRQWFLDFLTLALESRYWGHSLIQLGSIIRQDGVPSFQNVELIPRKHVVPEYGMIVRDAGDDWRRGKSYREGDFATWSIEVGSPRNLGLLLKCAPHALSKKNMAGYWDTFGEVFGMPIRIGKTMSTDTKDIMRIENMLADMGAAAWGLFPEGTEIEIKEGSRGDAFNVYDKRIDRCNSEMSKGVLNQTMTIDSGSSLSQSETHLEVFENVCKADALLCKYIVNGELIPRMIRLGFPLHGCSFDWDEAVSFSPAEQREMERVLLQYYRIDPQHFIDKYKVPILGEREVSAGSFFD